MLTAGRGVVLIAEEHGAVRSLYARTIPVILLAGSGQQDLGLATDEAWIHAVLSKRCPQEDLVDHVSQAVAYSSELRQMLALAPARPVMATTAPASEGPAPATSGSPDARRGSDGIPPATTLYPCPRCGESALELLGETGHSIVLRCTACHDVSVERRR